jgi:putative SOS response-associated peptidase YedK
MIAEMRRRLRHPPRYAGRTDTAPLAREGLLVFPNGERHMDELIWPLIPIWAKGEVPKCSTANAISETMAEKPAYRNAWKQQQRCVVVATAFYEWQVVEHHKNKQPWLLKPAHAPFFCHGRALGTLVSARCKACRILHHCDQPFQGANKLKCI